MVQLGWNSTWLQWLPKLIKFLPSTWYGLCKGDSYISNFFLRNPLTDVTLDATNILLKLQKFIKYLYLFITLFKTIEVVLLYTLWGDILSSWSIICHGIFEFYFNCCIIETILILDSRLVILRRKLERYGFKNIRDAKFGQQVYCEMYLRIIQRFHAIGIPPKLMMAFDMVINCVQIITLIVRVFIDSRLRQKVTFGGYGLMVFTMLLVTQHCGSILLPCFMMEACAENVEAMRRLVVTELIKYPNAQQRRAMLDFLELTEAAPAQLSPCRAISVDARLSFALFTFCTSHVISFIQMLDQN